MGVIFMGGNNYDEMNKARRHELKMLKFKKRLALRGLKSTDGNMNALRFHSCPCSCSICSYVKYKRENTKEIRFAISLAC